jgi:hypothetical protein
MFKSCINAVKLDYSRCAVYDRPIFDPKSDLEVDFDNFGEEPIECNRECPRYFPDGD